MPATLLIASHNRGKLVEFQQLIGDFPIQLLLPDDLGLHLDVVEDGLTYAENAALKARAFAQASQLPALADDSGLEVDALGGQPGIYSARYAPIPNASDADRRRHLLHNLHGLPRPWHAHFHCTVALATPAGEVWYAEGDCFGEIIPEERGQNGFGYDPIFWLPELGCTMAELSREQKNRLSHRGRAVLAAVPLLKQVLAI